MLYDAEKLARSIERAPDFARRTARDYLREDRLVRRFRIGSAFYAAELRGYRSTYYVLVRLDQPEAAADCTCDRPKQPCPHSTALLLDLESKPGRYDELGWRAILGADAARDAAPLTASLDWSSIPETPPWWRTALADEAAARIEEMLRSSHRARALDRDPLTEIFSELNPTVAASAAIQALYKKWAQEHRAGIRPEDGPTWVNLHWMQPSLVSGPLQLPPAAANSAVHTLLHRLSDPSPWLDTTPERLNALMHDLTVLSPDLGHQLWSYHNVSVLSHADALFEAGHRQLAASWLESELPDDPDCRRQARIRLVDWLDVDATIPHRLALTWETGRLDWVEPVRDHLKPHEWDSIVNALKTPPSEG